MEIWESDKNNIRKQTKGLKAGIFDVFRRLK